MAPVVDCPCGHALDGKDHEEPFVLAKQHAKEHRPDSSRSDEEIRQLFMEVAQDA